MRRFLTFGVLILSLLFFASPALAQTKIESGKSYQLVADSNGQNVTAYRFFVDGVQVGADVPVSALANGSISSPSELTSTLKPGVHTLEVAAVNPDFVVKSAPLSIEVGFTAPAAPTNLRLVLVIQVATNGAVTFQLVEATKLPDGGK